MEKLPHYYFSWVVCFQKQRQIYGVENWRLWKVDQKYLVDFSTWCWRRMEKIRWEKRKENEVLRRVKEARNTLQTIKRRKANWIGHILSNNCLFKTHY
jgi:predicted GH43/DUF377 family glycosyl hydrolase